MGIFDRNYWILGTNPRKFTKMSIAAFPFVAGSLAVLIGYQVNALGNINKLPSNVSKQLTGKFPKQLPRKEIERIEDLWNRAQELKRQQYLDAAEEEED